jgi:hypothetical protein
MHTKESLRISSWKIKQTGKQLIHACPEDRQADQGDDSGQNCMTSDLEATELELFA